MTQPNNRSGLKPSLAIIGSGISGIYCAHHLQDHFDITLFEKNDYVGGHTHTENVKHNGKTFPINTGFIVFNDWTYPNFIAFMKKLGVASEDSNMSFSVKCARTGVEYNGTNLNKLFAQRENLVSLSFLRMVFDILRFNKALRDADAANSIDPNETLGNYLKRKRYSMRFIDHYIVPMGAAIWSCGEDHMENFPLAFFARFFNNHGMLSVGDRPQWRVITNGSAQYVKAFLERFEGKIITRCPVLEVIRDEHGASVVTANGISGFDYVIFASHADEALKMLNQPTDAESSVLSAIQYLENEVVLHTDKRVLPKNHLAWAAWNYRVGGNSHQQACVTYNMNVLQNLSSGTTFCVTLNRTQDIDPATIIKRYSYSHPLYTREAVSAQRRFNEISGKNRTFYCGAYWFNGFHEDGVNSAIRACEQIKRLIANG